MSYILTSSYSTISGHADADYAAALAHALGLPLQLLHTYIIPVSVGEIAMPLVPAADMQAAAAVRADALADDLRSRYPQLAVSTKIGYGALADVLADEIAAAPPLLTVIGHDEEDAGAWLGTEATDALRESSGPVLAVPRNAPFRKPANLCLACDTRSIKEGLPLTALLPLQEVFDFRITVLHVRAGAEPALDFEDQPLGRQLAGFGATYSEVPVADSIDATIAAFIAAQDVDWLAIVPHHYGFWEGLFHKSHTSQALHLAHLPVLALHEMAPASGS